MTIIGTQCTSSSPNKQYMEAVAQHQMCVCVPSYLMLHPTCHRDVQLTCHNQLLFMQAPIPPYHQEWWAQPINTLSKRDWSARQLEADVKIYLSYSANPKPIACCMVLWQMWRPNKAPQCFSLCAFLGLMMHVNACLWAPSSFRSCLEPSASASVLCAHADTYVWLSVDPHTQHRSSKVSNEGAKNRKETHFSGFSWIKFKQN